MKFIRPVTLTDAMLISSSVAETDYAAWSGATTYAAGNHCIKTSTHRIYESVQAGNLNHDPASDDGTWWLDIGPTNRWAMFDQTVGTVTSGTTPLAVTLAPGVVVNGLGLLDLAGTSVTVTMTDGAAGPTVYDRTFALEDAAEVTDWFMYFFEPISPQTSLIVEDLPPYSSGRITVSIAAAATAECGTLSFGGFVDIGRTLAGPGVGIIDYSRKETDVFGVTSVIQRAYAKKIEASAIISNARLDYIAKQLAAVRAIPCIWAVDEGAGVDALVAYGFYKDWRINIAYPQISEFAITLEGLT